MLELRVVSLTGTNCAKGDTKAGTYIASDRYGNKYYENLEEELPCDDHLMPCVL